MAHSGSYKPFKKDYQKYYWFVHKQTGEITCGILYNENTPTSYFEMIGIEEPQTPGWVSTHFHLVPIEIPKEIFDIKITPVEG